MRAFLASALFMSPLALGYPKHLADNQPIQRRAVSSTAKAGLAWPNGPDGGIQQYTSTGKVQWCVMKVCVQMSVSPHDHLGGWLA